MLLFLFFFLTKERGPSAHYISMTYPRIQSVSAFTLVPGRGISVWDFGILDPESSLIGCNKYGVQGIEICHP